MARVKRGVVAKARHKKVLRKAKGYYGARRKTFKVANQAVTKAGQYAGLNLVTIQGPALHYQDVQVGYLPKSPPCQPPAITRSWQPAIRSNSAPIIFPDTSRTISYPAGGIAGNRPRCTRRRIPIS